MSTAFHGRLTDNDKDKDLLGKPVESKRNLEKKVHPKPVFVRPAIQTRIRRATGIRTPRKERERERRGPASSPASSLRFTHCSSLRLERELLSHVTCISILLFATLLSLPPSSSPELSCISLQILVLSLSLSSQRKMLVSLSCGEKTRCSSSFACLFISKRFFFP